MDFELIEKLDSFRYVFNEQEHKYFVNNAPVQFSVTQFIERYYVPFDSETISKKYAEKHELNQKDVLDDWKKKGDISAFSGTIIHKFLQEGKEHKMYFPTYDDEKLTGLSEEVKQRVDILLPKAKAFLDDTEGKLIPVKLEYIVGYKDLIAGSIDMLCWNKTMQELQIWDYKNTKEIATSNSFGKIMKEPFLFSDCNYNHYSIQLSMYKTILEMATGLNIGSCNIVHFNYTKEDNSFDIYPARDFSDYCKHELEFYLENKL